MKLVIIAALIFFQSIFSQEVSLIEIPLSGEAKERSLEMSGLAWYKDNLILMPQYVKKDAPSFYYLNKKNIIKWIEGGHQKNPLEPDKIKLELPNFENIIQGFQGFEAIAFFGNKAYMVIESKNNGKMKSFIVKGKLDFRNRKLEVDTIDIKEIPISINIKNMGFESILKYK